MYMSKVTFDNTVSRDKTDLQCHVEARKNFIQYTLTNLYKGSFNNYLNQILSKFDLPHPSSGQKWTLYIL